MEVDLFEAFTVVAFLMSVASFYFSRQEKSSAQVKELENRLTTLELKIEPIWDAVRREIPKLLINPLTGEFNVLMQKAMNELEMTDAEVTRLKQLVDDEYEKALRDEKKGRAVGLALFRATLGVNQA